MKNGFTWQGFEADLRGGSFYRAQEEFQFGKQIGDWSVYIAGTQINDGGWRVDSASQLTNFYGDRRLQGERVRVAPATDCRQHPVRRRRLHADRVAAEQLGQRLHRSPDDLQPDGDAAIGPANTPIRNTLSFQGGPISGRSTKRMSTAIARTLSPCPPFSCLNGNPAHDTFGGIIPDISQKRNTRPRRDRSQLDPIALGRRQRAGRRHRQGLRSRQYAHVRRVARLRLDAFHRQQPARHDRCANNVVPCHRLPLHSSMSPTAF